MPQYYCPCGSILNPNSTVRFLKSPSLRLFVSIRTMKSASPETKVCNVCRTAYYTWKSNNAEFGNIFSRIEEETTDVEEMINMHSNESIDMDQGYLSNRTSRLMQASESLM
ncbi:unnamed protein product [Rotaria socialis]|uniref:Uncharacterized protein n=2 Tax=Rotaria socialis TaxID=392032 RepID=A0A818XEU1_9BILA|nr:unnamed protein product [Rotaria socialis]CAF4433213.1 unnamed protein product [Rotaria socialis]CAF4492586.1 unnamed protein product [Rotaria socialis]